MEWRVRRRTAGRLTFSEAGGGRNDPAPCSWAADANWGWRAGWNESFDKPDALLAGEK
jgi:hypothetical protein